MVIASIFIVSLILGVIKYGSINNAKSWQIKFAEIWNDVGNFLLAGLIGYYFILVRWPLLSGGATLSISDFALFIIFALGLFGHLCVISKNITDGIRVIIERILKEK